MIVPGLDYTLCSKFVSFLSLFRSHNWCICWSWTGLREWCYTETEGKLNLVDSLCLYAYFGKIIIEKYWILHSTVLFCLKAVFTVLVVLFIRCQFSIISLFSLRISEIYVNAVSLCQPVFWHETWISFYISGLSPLLWMLFMHYS